MTSLRWLPGVQVARTYHRSWLSRDVVAGLVLTSLLVPAGMGYAQAAGLPPIYGLYSSLVPLLVYAVVGPSRILVMSPDSALAPLIAAAVVPLAGADAGQLVALASMIAILTGVLCLVAGLARFGFLVDLLSKPVRYGYLNGIALIVFVSQVPRLLGFSIEADGVVSELRAIAKGIGDGNVNGTSLALGLAAFALIVGCQAVAPRVPAPLLAVVASILVVGAFDLQAHGIAVVGTLPQGLPAFAVPHVAWSDFGTLLAAATGIALVAFADTSVLSRTFAVRRHDAVDANQELVALGAVNVACGLFQGFSVSGSATRTSVADSAGSKSQLTGVVGAASIAVLLVTAPGLFRNLPAAVLAAVVMAAALRLVEVTGVRRLRRVRRGEFLLSMACFLAIALLGPIRGIALAVLLAVVDFVRRAWRPHTAELVRVDGLKGYHDGERHPEGRRIPGLVLYRFDAPLFFANADLFKAEILRLIELDGGARWVVVTAEPITDVDTTAADALADLSRALAARGIVLAFAELKGYVRERLARYGLVAEIGAEHFYPTTGQAVKAYVKATGTTWTDWEDRPTP